MRNSSPIFQSRVFPWGAVCGLALFCPVAARAWEPSPEARDAAVAAGDFAGYLANLTTWLDQRVPSDPVKITGDAMEALLKDPVFTAAADHRQFIVKLGADQLAAFAKSDAAHPEFLRWVFKDSEMLEGFLQATGPTPIPDRDANGFSVSPAVMDIWFKIVKADPEAKQGIYQKLAMATAIAPPGTGARGAGQPATPADPLDRYLHFKNAHKNKELFASFDDLTVWEYTKVVQSGASDADLAWAREMINTWRPDLRIKEQVVESTREVWRRNSPIDFAGTYKNVLAGGGKCGPRSSWAVMICQAFGIPAVGVGQSAHACVAARSAYPEMQPQPGLRWKVHQGMGWQVSRLDGTNGPTFLEAIAEREHRGDFTRIEHLRWVASALAAKERADAVRAVAAKIRGSLPPSVPAAPSAPQPDPNVEGVAKTTAAGTATPPAVPEEPFKEVPGTIHIEAETFVDSFAEPAFPAEQKGCVYVLDCHTGGKQLNFQKNMNRTWVDYKVDVPAAGTYAVTARVAVVNFDQVLDLGIGETKLATIKLANSFGKWATTEPVDVKLEKGPQTLRVSAPMQRGVAIRWFELKTK